MKEIPLNRGFVALVDDEDYEDLSQHRWRVNGDGYAIRMVPHPTRRGRQICIYMHRHVAGLSHGNPLQADHWDNNRLNNRRLNLRICEKVKNARNRVRSSRNTSGYKGVSWRERDHSWRAVIGFEGRSIHLGQFKTAEEAYEAYCKAAIQYHGEFANLGGKAA
ncbi:AP2 domain-containing protein [Paraburkholderia elongata]|uniref:Fis family transcriptional regulator n=1 Tax=Paraburkholderia elongata TaxID=2675747 RepID=A0A972NWY0_9BURK|nr:AP2 domain-containing protein [Paraburkholderia elongata]NPT59135.1 Fis family transcriptional regulator [Paraburkholderia elongata]